METSLDEVARTPQPTEHKPSRLECLGGVIVSPARTFEYLASRPQWLFPLIVLVLWVLVSFAVRMIVTFATLFPGTIGRMGGETGGQISSSSAIVMGAFFGAVWLIFSLAGTIAVFMAMAGVLYLIALAFRIKPHFYPLASTLAYAEFVPRLVRASVEGAMPLFTGNFGFIQPRLPTGVLEIYSQVDFPMLLHPLLGRVELFHIWSFVLVAVSLQFTGGASKNKAIVATVLYWAVCILAVTGVTALGELFRMSIS